MTGPVAVAADVVAVTMRHLAGLLDVPVLPRRPDGEPTPDRFVVVLGTGGGGGARRLLTVTQVTLDSYARTDGQAVALALDVDACLRCLPGSPGPVTHVTGTYPGVSPDPDTDRARASATYQLTSHLLRKDPTHG